jgi:NIMA-interacting peptidyl-prolyl cis-trans isomerase 1
MSQVRASHILIKHSGSRNPVSRRTGHHIDISKEQAAKELKEIQQIITKENFGEIAKKRSDCGSFAGNGDLGLFGRGQMQRPFEEASFALGVGEISNIVDTDSGLHLIYRTA